jgi:hypothetical protein
MKEVKRLILIDDCPMTQVSEYSKYHNMVVTVRLKEAGDYYRIAGAASPVWFLSPVDNDWHLIDEQYLYPVTGKRQPPAIPVCQCGAIKTYGESASNYHHAYWCRLSEL